MSKCANFYLNNNTRLHPTSLSALSNFDSAFSSQDIFSYNVEQSKGDTHNMIVIVQRTQGLELQEAVDFVGQLCKQSIDRFVAASKRLPSFDNGGQIDRDVAQYVKGLEDWIVGSLHWSFESERYFSKEGRVIKKTRTVNLLPKRTN